MDCSNDVGKSFTDFVKKIISKVTFEISVLGNKEIVLAKYQIDFKKVFFSHLLKRPKFHDI